MDKLTSPVWRYGGKGLLCEWIISHLPRVGVGRYIEEFGGGASVLLNIWPPYQFEIYNDLSEELTHIFRMLRERPDELWRALLLTQYSRVEYLDAGDFDPSSVCDVERARRWLVKHRQSFSGKGEWSSGLTGNWSRTIKNNAKVAGWTNWIESAYWPIIERLRHVQIDKLDGIECFQKYDRPDTLHYCDPPYVEEARHAGAEYREMELSPGYHELLLDTLCKCKGMVALSGYHNELYDTILRDAGFVCFEKDVSMVAANSADVGPDDRRRIECLWLNDAAVKRAGAGRQLSLFDGEQNGNTDNCSN